MMDNHYHLLVETPDPNLSMGMRQLNGVYTQYSNRRHGKVGHLFQGRFKSILVEKEAHLLELCRYVVLNPVRAKLCEHPGDWLWSNYRATSSGKSIPNFLSTGWTLQQFTKQKKRARELYIGFVEEGGSIHGKPWSELKGQVFLGGEGFLEKMRGYLTNVAGSSEIPKKQRQAGRPPLQEIIPKSIFKDKDLRNEAILNAYLEYGYTLKQIADLIGIHYTTVSRVISSRKSK